MYFIYRFKNKICIRGKKGVFLRAYCRPEWPVFAQAFLERCKAGEYIHLWQKLKVKVLKTKGIDYVIPPQSMCKIH